jgi:hypothetical protein
MTIQRTQSKINSEKKQDEPNISEIKENEEEHNVNLDEHEYIGIEENPEIELKVEPKEPPEEEVLDDFERRLKRIRRNN